MREEGSGTRKEARKQLKKAGINPSDLDIIASIENQETIKKSVRQGMGVSVLSRLATNSFIFENSFCSLSFLVIQMNMQIDLSNSVKN